MSKLGKTDIANLDKASKSDVISFDSQEKRTFASAMKLVRLGHLKLVQTCKQVGHIRRGGAGFPTYTQRIDITIIRCVAA